MPGLHRYEAPGIPNRGGQWGLNPQPSGPQPDALPIELWPPRIEMCQQVQRVSEGELLLTGTPARGQGFEPRYGAPKAPVLPLDDPRLPGHALAIGAEAQT